MNPFSTSIWHIEIVLLLVLSCASKVRVVRLYYSYVQCTLVAWLIPNKHNRSHTIGLHNSNNTYICSLRITVCLSDGFISQDEVRRSWSSLRSFCGLTNTHQMKYFLFFSGKPKPLINITLWIRIPGNHEWRHGNPNSSSQTDTWDTSNPTAHPYSQPTTRQTSLH